MELKLDMYEWCQRTGIRVVDPDGWNRKDSESFFVKIDRDEFLRRASFSTCMMWPKPLFDEKWLDDEA